MTTTGYPPSYYHNVFTTPLTLDPLWLVLKHLQQLNTCISTIDTCMLTIKLTNKDILKVQDEISVHIQKNEETNQLMQTTLMSLTENPVKSGSSKNVSNQHLKLKVSDPYFECVCMAQLSYTGYNPPNVL